MMAAATTDARPTLSALMRGLADVPASLDRPVAALGADSRAVEAGGLFFARRGLRTDATTFAAEAAAAGAAAMVFEGAGAAHVDRHGLLRIPVLSLRACEGGVAHRFYGRPSEQLAVIAVTGTNGKSSVSHFVAAALERAWGRPVGVIGTLGVGLGGRLNDSGLTTPDCLQLHAALAEFAAANASAAVLEASSHALHQGRLEGVRVHSAVFTNLSRDHLDYHHSMDAYAAAKAQLFAAPELRAAVINAADPYADRMLDAVRSGAAVLRFSLAADVDAEIRGQVERLDRSGLELRVEVAGKTHRVNSVLLGETSALNLLAALGVLLALDVPAQRATRLLEGSRAVAGRMQPIGGKRDPLVVVDYAHTPDALAAALATLRPLCRGALWCVFGAGGERDTGKRPLMGAAALAADRVIVTDDNPRGEDPDQIVAAVLDGIPLQHRERVSVLRDRATAIEHALRLAHENDVVLIAGKGHERFQQVGARRLPFNDAAAVRAALARRDR